MRLNKKPIESLEDFIKQRIEKFKTEKFDYDFDLYQVDAPFKATLENYILDIRQFYNQYSGNSKSMDDVLKKGLLELIKEYLKKIQDYEAVKRAAETSTVQEALSNMSKIIDDYKKQLIQLWSRTECWSAKNLAHNNIDIICSNLFPYNKEKSEKLGEAYRDQIDTLYNQQIQKIHQRNVPKPPRVLSMFERFGLMFSLSTSKKEEKVATTNTSLAILDSAVSRGFRGGFVQTFAGFFYRKIWGTNSRAESSTLKMNVDPSERKLQEKTSVVSPISK